MYIVAARDFHSPLFRNEIWVNSLYLWPKMFNIPRAFIGIESKNNEIFYFLDPESFSISRKAFLNQVEDDSGLLKRVIDLSGEYGEEMNAFTQTILDSDLSQWSDEQLSDFYREFCALQARQYAVGTLLPLIDLMGVSYIELHLKQILQKHLSSQEADGAFGIFTTPTKNSFSLDQEEDLLRIAVDFFADEDCRLLLRDGEIYQIFPLLQERFPLFAERIRLHTQKYAWVYYVYQGPAFSEAQFIQFLQEYLIHDIDPKLELERRKREREKLFAERDHLLSRIPLTEYERMIVLIASEFVWAKPRRKDYQSRSYFHIEFFFREFARRMGVSLRHARAATQEQIYSGLRTHVADQDRFQQQYVHHIITQGHERAGVIFGEEARVFSQNIAHEHASSEGIRELRGSTAFTGKACGAVRIVNTPEDMVKMNYGDILVAVATTPSCVPAMKKAAAIISDEGGLTCHAAIVSRELRVPCVVGTKIATHVLKDGDEVEVDAEKGTVRVLSRS